MDAEPGAIAHPAGGITGENAQRWLAAVPARHSRRSYTGERVPAADLDALEALAARWQPWPRARAVVIREAPQAVFAGIIGAYGGIAHAPSALAFVGARDARKETIGYTGEGIVLEAAARGLDTCWVAGLFSARETAALADVKPSERVYAVAALGYARDAATAKERVLFGAARAKHRRPVSEIAPGCETWPVWARSAVEAVRLAPSAMNRQPWRFALTDGGLVLRIAGADTPRTSKHLDGGIAMLHAEIGALGAGVAGVWELLDGPDAAILRPGERSAPTR